MNKFYYHSILMILLLSVESFAAPTMSVRDALEITGRFVAADIRTGRLTSFCSGILLDEKWVLTASHCIVGAKKYVDTKHYSISFQLPNNSDPAIASRAFTIKQFKLNENFSSDDFKSDDYSKFISSVGYDFSYVELAQTISGQPTISYFDDGLSDGEILTHLSADGADGQLAGLIGKTLRLESESGQVVIAEGRQNLVPGNSGGPVFVNTKDGRLSLLGLVSAVSNGSLGREFYFVKYSSSRHEEIYLTKWKKMKKLVLSFFQLGQRSN